MQAAIYCRVSTDEQVKGFSLPTQLEACRKYAAAHGYTVPPHAEFLEDHTGKVMDRPELEKLRQLVHAGAVQVVIVYDIDRLSRKMAHQVLLEEELQRAGARIEYVLSQHDDSPEGQFQKQVKAILAEYERTKMLERMTRGKKGRVQAGQISPGRFAPYGYRYVNSEHEGHLEIDDEEAQFVSQMFEWYVNGDESGRKLGSIAIARRLTEMRIPTRHDRLGIQKPKREVGVWCVSAVGRILKSELYIGNWYYNRLYTGSQGKRGLRDRSEWIKVSVPAIVSQELWEAAQRQRSENTQNSPRNTQYKYLLRSRLVCADCGFAVSAVTKHRPNGTFAYYRCNGQMLHTSKDYTGYTCHRSLRRDDVDANVWERIKTILQNPDLILDSLRRKQAEAEMEVKVVRQRLEAVENRIQILDRQRAKLLDLFLAHDSAIPKEMLEAKMAELAQQQTAFHQEADDLRSRVERDAISDTTIHQVQIYCEKARQGLEAFTFEDKEITLDALNIKGILKRGNTQEEDTIILTGYISVPEDEQGGDVGPIATQPS